jgi:hypothetical protein
MKFIGLYEHYVKGFKICCFAWFYTGNLLSLFAVRAVLLKNPLYKFCHIRFREIRSVMYFHVLTYLIMNIFRL